MWPTASLNSRTKKLTFSWPTSFATSFTERPVAISSFSALSPLYHVLSGGFIPGELLRRVTGREQPELLREETVRELIRPIGGMRRQYATAVAINRVGIPVGH